MAFEYIPHVLSIKASAIFGKEHFWGWFLKCVIIPNPTPITTTKEGSMLNVIK